jgi:hypothetical protein
LLAIGRDDLARNQSLLTVAAADVDGHRPARDVMSRLAQDHPTAEQLSPRPSACSKPCGRSYRRKNSSSFRRPRGVGWKRRRPLRVGVRHDGHRRPV